MSRRKWYVVWNGRAPGIYDSWEECKLQVENYPDAKYKAFDSQNAATAAFRGNPEEHINLLRQMAKAAPKRIVNYEAIPEIILDSIAVDASCMGNPGIMEYQGVHVRTGKVLFRIGPFQGGTNNIGEYLAIIHALALTKKQGKPVPIYSDSRTAQAWVRNRQCKSTLQRTPENGKVFEVFERAQRWLATNSYSNRIIKWNTEEWGEIPADFGRK